MCSFTGGGREIDEMVVPGAVLFSARWFDLNGEGARKEIVDLEGLGDSMMRMFLLNLEILSTSFQTGHR